MTATQTDKSVYVHAGMIGVPATLYPEAGRRSISIRLEHDGEIAHGVRAHDLLNVEDWDEIVGVDGFIFVQQRYGKLCISSIGIPRSQHLDIYNVEMVD